MCFLRWPSWAYSTASKRPGNAENISKCPRVDVCFCLYTDTTQMTLSMITYIFFQFSSGTDKRIAYSNLNIHKGSESPGTTSVENKSKHCFFRIIG